MERIKLTLTFAIMISLIGGVLYWISTKAEKDKSDRMSQVAKSYKYSKGIIVKISSYKGHSIKVKYRIRDMDYEYTGGWDYNPKNIGVGDSISFKYATTNPSLIITEVEDGF